MFKMRMILSWLLLCSLFTAAAYVLVSDLNYNQQYKLVEQSVDDAMARATGQMKVQSAKRLHKLRKMAGQTPLLPMLQKSNGIGKEALGRLHNQSWSFVEKANVQLGANQFVFVNAEGKVVARQSDRSRFGDGLKGLPVVKALLNGLSTETVQIFNNQIVQIYGAPIVDLARKKVIGGFVAFYNLDQNMVLKLQNDLEQDFAVFLEGKTVVSSNAQGMSPQFAKALDNLSGNGYEESNPFSSVVSLDNNQTYMKVFRLSKGIKDYNAGLASFKTLPPMWLPLNNKVAMLILGGGFLLFFCGFAISLAASRWLKKSASKQAEIIKTMMQTETYQAQFNVKKTTQEFAPLVLAFSELAEQKRSGSKKKKTEKQSISDAINSATENIKQTRKTNKSSSTTQRKFTEAEKRALEKRESEYVMNELSQMISNSPEDSTKTATEKAIEQPQMKTEASSISSNKQRIVEHMSLEPEVEAKVEMPTEQATPEIKRDQSEYFETVYNDFINLRGILGQPTHNVNKDKFLANLNGNAKRIMKKTSCSAVNFTVFEKDGKASVKAVPAS